MSLSWSYETASVVGLDFTLSHLLEWLTLYFYGMNGLFYVECSKYWMYTRDRWLYCDWFAISRR